MRPFSVIMIISAIFIPTASLAEDFVKAGKPVSVRTEGKEWTRGDGYLECSGTHNYLLANKEIGSGDFTIRAKIEIKLIHSTAASIVLGDSHFLLDGKAIMFCIEGPLFGGKTKAICSVVPFLKTGRPFDVLISRKGKRVTFYVGGKKVTEAEGVGPVGRIGLRPWRNTMKVYSFSATGNLKEPLPKTPLFSSGQDGYNTFRIPALLVTKKGTLLAFCEGRKKSRSDTGDIDLVMKRSEDGGKTWSTLQVVRDDADNTCGNPCPVQDSASGKIFLPTTWNLGTDHEGYIIQKKSKDTRRIFMQESADAGKTWTDAVEITRDVKKEDWTWYATGPGHGIQIFRGEHKGRLVIPCDHIEAKTRKYFSHIFYSDDRGKTWKLGGSTPTDKVNECMVAERGEGELVLNMRNYDRRQKVRAISTSRDGGMTWSELKRPPDLIEPRCQASLVNYDLTDIMTADWMLFSNPAHPDKRVRMTVRFSPDGAKTWPNAMVLHTGPSAYSDLGVLADKTICCLHEGGNAGPYEHIYFTRITLEQIRKSKAK